MDRQISTIPAGIRLDGPAADHPQLGTVEVRSKVRWSPNGRQVAYVGFSDEGRHAVVGDHVCESHDFLSSVAFGDLSDEMGSSYDASWECTYSQDGNKLAFKVLRKGKMGVATNEGEDTVTAWDYVTRPVPSADGKLVAFAAKASDGWRVHCDAAASDAYDQVGPLHFDEAGATIGFGARRGQDLLGRTLQLSGSDD